MSQELDYVFRAMGSDVRLLIGPRLLPGAPPALDAADRERAFVRDFACRLSRFIPESELSGLNRDPRSAVPSSKLLCAAVAAGIWAAERSGGLVEPTLAQALERAGYGSSLDGISPASLQAGLDAAPDRQPARPDPQARWREIIVDDRAGVIRRPPGVKIDTGGTGKGLCADAVAVRLRKYARYAVDCGGDIAVGGVGAQIDPYWIRVEHPLTGRATCSISVPYGGIATSGLNVRIWRTHEGRFGHHLLDPSTGEPAWTGLIAATALAGSALEAETLAKMALLSGPEGALGVLADQGGLIVHDSGEVEVIGLGEDRISWAPNLRLVRT